MDNAIVVSEQNRSVITSFDDVARVAKAMSASGYFQDSKDAAQAIVKILAGHELGIGPFASMTGVHIIQGKPAIGANVVATLVKNDPRYNYIVRKCDHESCIIEWFEVGHSIGVSSFTMDEANSAGLTGKDNWRKYPSDMLFARAITRGARRFAPGIFGGAPVYTPDELGADMDADGYVEPEQVTVTTTQETPQPRKTKATRANGWNPVQVLLDAGVCDNANAASELLNRYVPNDIKLSHDAALLADWGKQYRGFRDGGDDPETAATLATSAVS